MAENNNSVFQNSYTSAQTWDMQGAVIWFSGCSDTAGLQVGAQNANTQKAESLTSALIVQSLSISFGRSVSKVYPINIAQAIQILGIPEGTATIGLIWGPGKSFRNFVNCFKDSCSVGSTGQSNGKAIHVKPFGKACSTSKDGTASNAWSDQGVLTIMSPVLSTLGVTVQAAQGNFMPVQASVGLSFIDLQLA